MRLLSARSRGLVAFLAGGVAVWVVTPVVAHAAASGKTSAAASAKASDDDFGDEPSGKSKPATLYAPVESPSLYGSTGLLRMSTASIERPGALRFQILTEYFRATQFIQTNPYDTNRRWGLRLAATYAPTAWLETFVMVTGSFNENAHDTAPPNVTSTNLFGDVTLGVKLSAHLGKLFSLGAEAAVLLLTAAGPAGYSSDFGATSARLRALATLDLRALTSGLPLRLHANAGAIIDNSSSLLQPSYGQLARFALRINQTSRFLLSLGLDAPINSHVTPFLEWGVEIPLGDLPSTTKPQGLSAYPNIVSAGVRLSPLPWFALLAAVDVGLTNRGQLGLPPIPPWQFMLAVSFAMDTQRPPPSKAAPAKATSDTSDGF